MCGLGPEECRVHPPKQPFSLGELILDIWRSTVIVGDLQMTPEVGEPIGDRPFLLMIFYC